ncbi:MAG: hypothetical protein ACJAV1_001749 [Paraglaciecola sp.]|jgi:hypothetical protein
MEGINSLIKKGWVLKAAKSHVQFYALHPVMSDVAKNSFESMSNKLSEEKVGPLFEKALLLLSDEVFDKAHPGHFHGLSPLLSFLAHLNSHTIQYTEVIALIAYRLHYIANYATALPLYERALSISEKVLGLEHPNTKTISKNMQYCMNKKLPLFEFLCANVMASNLNSFEYFLRTVIIYLQLSLLCLNWGSRIHSTTSILVGRYIRLLSLWHEVSRQTGYF